MQANDARVPHLNPDAEADLSRQGRCARRDWARQRGEPDLGDLRDASPMFAVEKAYMMYSLNGGTELKYRAPRLEEWIYAPVKLTDGRVEAVAPPGMTHAVFCLIDANNFLVYSEPVPPVGKVRIDAAVSLELEDGFAYRPGLFSLIKVGHEARGKLLKQGVNVDALTQALKAARATCKLPVEEKTYALAIRNLAPRDPRL